MLIKFKIPEEYMEDYKLIVSGKYSQISDLAKTAILDYHKPVTETVSGQNVLKEIDGVLNKTQFRIDQLAKEFNMVIPRDIELYEKMVLEKEMFLDMYSIRDEIINKELE